MSLVSSQCREKHTAQPVQFGTPPAFFSSFGDCFRLDYCVKSFRSSVGAVQGLIAYIIPECYRLSPSPRRRLQPRPAQAGACNLHVGLRPHLEEAGAGCLSFFLFILSVEALR